MLPLSLIAGQSGRLNFSGSFSGALSAAIFRRGREALALQVSGSSVRIPPTLEPGLHLLEARAGGRTLLHRHVEVLPGDGAPEAEKVWDIDLTQQEQTPTRPQKPSPWEKKRNQIKLCALPTKPPLPSSNPKKKKQPLLLHIETQE